MLGNTQLHIDMISDTKKRIIATFACLAKPTGMLLFARRTDANKKIDCTERRRFADAPQFRGGSMNPLIWVD